MVLVFGITQLAPRLCSVLGALRGMASGLPTLGLCMASGLPPEELGMRTISSSIVRATCVRKVMETLTG